MGTGPTADAAAVIEALGGDPGRTALLFDIDGVLAPIVPHANDARVPDEALDVLARLARRFLVVGVVSGRAMADVDRMVPIPGLARGGNHGMEVAAPGGEAELVAEARALMPALRAFVEACPGDDMAAHGAWLEDKGASVSLHFRESADPDAAEAYLEGTVADRARALGLKVRRGRMIVEVLPDVQVDKGTAVREIVQSAGAEAAMYVGDDRTDMDAWRGLREMVDEGLLQRAVCVLADQPEVGDDVRAAADMAVAGTVGVVDLMRAMAA